MNFINIDLNTHKDIVVTFRKDSFRESFGHSGDFNEAEYMHWLKQKVQQFPEGFLLIEEDNECIGQMELTVKNYKGSDVGYINLYYLTESYRGKGYASKLHNHAERYFMDKGLKEYHLRVSPSNKRAIKFYENMSMEFLTEEHDGKVLRMRGYL